MPLAPKHNRQRRNVPTHGDYVRLEPLAKPVLPPLKGNHTPLAKAHWDAWRLDPVTVTWTATERALALHLVELIDADPIGKASEIRLRIDGLALSPKGRRDARLLLPDEEVEAEATPPQPAAEQRELPEAV